MESFRVQVPQDEVDELRRRLAAARWPAPAPGAGWERGTPTDYLRELADYWRTGFDWRAAESRINSFPQYVTTVDGTRVHFVHVKSPESGALPLVLTHGWPGSFTEFLGVIGPLTDPVAHGGSAADAFDVVVPSIPGYGFSGPTGQVGWDTERVARAWGQLMQELGYERYGAQGGDWGMPISLRLGLARPEQVVGVHVNMLVTFPPQDDPSAFDGLSPVELERLGRMPRFIQDGLGYQKIQSTRPQSLAYGLTDSPIGQLGWIIEKFMEWTDSVKSPEDAVSRDDLLTNASVYWFTATAGSSAQLYFESSRDDEAFFRTWGGPWPLKMPAGVAVFPKDATPPIRRFAEPILPTLARWTEFDRGGHFAALEQPDLFVDDVRAFFRPLR